MGEVLPLRALIEIVDGFGRATWAAGAAGFAVLALGLGEWAWWFGCLTLLGRGRRSGMPDLGVGAGWLLFGFRPVRRRVGAGV